MIKNVVECVIKQIVEYPEHVRITIIDTEDRKAVEVVVDERDRGKVIGRQGQTIKAVRALVNAVATQGERYSVDIAK